MKKIYAVATESDVVLAFESRSDADDLPKGGDRCRWCGHLFEDFTYRKVGPGAKEGAR